MLSMSKKNFKRLRKEIMYHECDLPPEEQPIIGFIDGGYCVYFRRFIRNSLLVSERNPRCSKVFQSKASIRRETERHLKYYYHVIHPFSDFMHYWEKLLTYVCCISLFVYPLLSYATNKTLKYFVYVKLGLDLIYLLDIIILFNCGYLNNNTNRVHLNRRQSAIQYLKTWFLLDLLCTVNIDLYFLYMENTFTLKFFNFVRVLRIASLVKYLTIYRQVNRYSLYKYNMFKIIILMWILLMWLTSFLYLMGTEYHEEWLSEGTETEKVVSCLYRVAYLFFLVGYGEGYSERNIIMIFEMTCWMIGINLRMFVLAEIVQIVNKYNAASNKYFQRIQRLRGFMRNKGLPSVICTRILQYFDYRFQKTFYKETQILSSLSEPLQKEIKYQTCIRLIENVMFFKDLPTAVMLKLVDRMSSVIVLPNDVIVEAGTVGDHMYFIHNGTVAVFTAAGVEVCHLTDGGNFGEVSIVMKDETRIATVVAVDACELYILSRADFEAVISPYPNLFNRIRKIAEERFKTTMGQDSMMYKSA